LQSKWKQPRSFAKVLKFVLSLMIFYKNNVRLAWIQPSFKESVKAQHFEIFCVLNLFIKIKRLNGVKSNTEAMICYF